MQDWAANPLARHESGVIAPSAAPAPRSTAGPGGAVRKLK